MHNSKVSETKSEINPVPAGERDGRGRSDCQGRELGRRIKQRKEMKVVKGWVEEVHRV